MREILRRAPAIAGWEFYEYRLADELSDAIAIVQRRTGGNLDGIEAAASLGQISLIDLKYYFPPEGFDEQEAVVGTGVPAGSRGRLRRGKKI